MQGTAELEQRMVVGRIDGAACRRVEGWNGAREDMVRDSRKKMLRTFVR
jgi:hypothetical protein